MPWTLVLWHPENCQLFVCSIVALVCTFYKRPLKHSWCERVLWAIYMPLSFVISPTASSSSWKAAAGCVQCSHRGLACAASFRSGCWQALVTNPRLYSWSQAEPQVWPAAGKLRGSHPVIMANKNTKKLGKHSVTPAQSQRAQIRGSPNG